ncbi:hypothetical protein NM688_g4338 [Phlebia brevispora]|uniref:Uncharacterized protein n=1 Tax=Phlebia brevispora TaxID=194682 RepID=A0ACC1T2W9_9APHY|nr:hypothetical protein NM688_g4338 [Phlebia brevispora]
MFCALSGALIPLEMCEVLPGQIMRKQVPDDKVKDVVQFSTKKPQDRLASIRNALGVLAYGQSEYVRQFGLHIEQQEPILAGARILPSPTLKYGGNNPGSTLIPREGAWNMVNRSFFQPTRIDRWGIVVFDRPQYFSQQNVQSVVRGFLDACRNVGINVTETDPTVGYANPQGAVIEELKKVGVAVAGKHGPKGFPQLLVVILPENAAEIYRAVKHFGDCKVGIATQCMKATKCARANAQYYANICLKVNVKMGGINAVLDQRSAAVLVDPHNPTIVMGADVIHPPPGSLDRPSFASLVASVDSYSAKYIADCRVQAPRQEMIAELDVMAKNMLQKYMGYRGVVEKKADRAPKRIIFYRDGVSEGQFQQVLDQELPQIQKACDELKIRPRITMIVVGKRHHVRFFPRNDNEADRSKNCKAGTVVDSDITHPVELDFYLLSHAGLLGTSRPAHYNVLYDDNGFTVDAIQALSFALCHVYARSTRSVSIPAPVYYADIVCSRAKNHYSPESNLNLDQSETRTSTGATSILEVFTREFQPLHASMRELMYFS